MVTISDVQEGFSWSPARLHALVTERLSGFKFVAVANREPYIHVRTPDGPVCVEPDSGVVAALNPVMRASGGTWVAHGSGSADRETSDAKGRLQVPPESPRYALRRVWLSPEEERGYYYGFSNEGLWPLCHIAYQRPTFEEADWAQYVRVNERFADAVVDECAGGRALIFIQDYHFALLPRLLKERLPNAVVAQFWHIPWPNPEAFRICPWKREILEGLLGNDLFALHIQHHANNFLEAIDRELESRIDRERFAVTLRGRSTLVRPHPISVDFDAISARAAHPATAELAEKLRRNLELEGTRVLLAVGRLDYTKGILERLRALDRLLDRHPELSGRITLVEIAVPSRVAIPAYRKFQDEVLSVVDDLNRRRGGGGWRPVLLLQEHQDARTLAAFYRLADVCLVTSLHDGMNLVAKEYVAARGDGQGVLLLSRFTGSARELGDAILVNPFAVDATAEAIHQALRLRPDERALRMSRLRAVVRESNVYRWAGKLLSQAARIDPS
jgi:trehalose 6-phosphate synthase